jgi:hypothetical protein
MRVPTILLGFCAAITANGCSHEPSPDDFTQAEVDTIIRKCGAKPEAIVLNRGFIVIAAPDEDDPIKSCIFRAVKVSGKSRFSMIANARYGG